MEWNGNKERDNLVNKLLKKQNLLVLISEF